MSESENPHPKRCFYPLGNLIYTRFTYTTSSNLCADCGVRSHFLSQFLQISHFLFKYNHRPGLKLTSRRGRILFLSSENTLFPRRRARRNSTQKKLHFPSIIFLCYYTFPCQVSIAIPLTKLPSLLQNQP